jgi:hypothetical protein
MGMTPADLERLLFRHDHIGLRVAGAPEDEYRPEAESVAERLGEAASASDVQRILHEEFSRWFSPDIAGPADGYRQAAEEIWATLSPCLTPSGDGA